ncbi:MAG: TonB family protein [Saprospiraceae bacterium]|nr:TonB family protein [Saprospiraceae bacterium]
MDSPNLNINDLLTKLTSRTLSDAERALLDQMAEEDPFIREAMEGYLNNPSNQSDNLKDLRRTLEKKRSYNRSILKKHPWRIAASLLLVVTASLIFLFSDRLYTPDENNFTALQSEEVNSPNLPTEPEEKPETVTGEEIAAAPAPKTEPPLPATREREEADNQLYEAPGQTATGASMMAIEKTGATLSGQVYDDRRIPLIGAQVTSNERDSSIYTDRDGRFVLEPANDKEQIVVSYTGYLSREINRLTRENLDTIVLEEDPVVMNEIARSFLAKSNAPTSADQARQSLRSSPVSPREASPLSGWTRFYAYIRQNKKVPTAALEAEVSGEVILSFIVDESGRLQNIRVEKSLGFGCDAEAIRLIENGPDWIPAEAPETRSRVTIRF